MPTFSEFVDGVIGSDAELGRQVPARPRINSDVELLPLGRDRIAFIGTENDVVMQGNQIRSLLATVLPLLDGNREMADICQIARGFPEDDVRILVRNLFFSGVLEDGPLGEPLGVAGGYLGRFCDSTRVHANRYEVVAALQSSRVVIRGPDACEVVQMKDDLRQAGVDAEIVQEAEIPVGTSLCVGVHARSNTAAIRSFLQEAHYRGVDGLYVGFGDDVWQLGPLFVPNKTTGLTAVLGHSAPSIGECNVTEWLVCLASQRVLCMLAGISRDVLTDRFELYSTEKGRLTRRLRYVSRWDGDRRTVGIGQYLSGTTQPPSKFVTPRHYQQHYAEANVRLVGQGQDGIAGTRPRRVIASDGHGEGQGTSSLLGSLGRLLRLAFGYHLGQRIAPTGGGLASPEAYLIVVDVPDLPAGVYRYRGLDHEFDEFVPASSAIQSILDSRTHRRPQAWLVLVGNVRRVSAKYGLYGLTIASYDAGIAEYYIRSACTSLRVPLSRVDHVGDRSVVSLLGLPIDGSFVSYGVFAIGEDSGTKAELPFGLAVDIGNPAGEDCSDVDEGHSAEVLAAHELELLALRRRSIREWMPKAVAAMEATRLAGAFRRSIRSYLDELGMSAAIKVYLVAGRATPELAAGIHRWEDGRFVLEGALDDARIVNQRNIGLAPMLLVPVVALRAEVTDNGPRAFISASVASGFAAGRVWLEAERLGLRGLAYGGLIESELQALVPSWHESDVAGLTFAAGYPVTEGAR